MRTEAELRVQLDKFKAQGKTYLHARDGIETMACALVCSVLAYALGETSSPTARFNLDQ